MTITKHMHPVVFGRREKTCSLCAELIARMAPVLRNRRREQERATLAAIRSHDCGKAACGPVCTFGDW